MGWTDLQFAVHLLHLRIGVQGKMPGSEAQFVASLPSIARQELIDISSGVAAQAL